MDIRAEFLNFFKKHNHTIKESAPLIPDDATLLFVNAGMVPFKSIFTGEVPAFAPRVASSQTCIRAGGKHNDLENVGFTNRHHTFFEMLGNFSFGDYFKKEAIKLAWEFVTEVLKLEKEKLWVSVHDSDDEAFEIWQNYIEAHRIKRFGDKDNFWQMGDIGPCGPCSEIFYDQGEEFNSKEDYFGGDGDRFLEIWNLVFMQYYKDENGTLSPLPKPSIDTGMGLERVTAIKEGVKSNYDTSLFMPIIKEISRLSNKEYIYESGASFRVIADHVRAVTFLLAQGVGFDKEGRGYVLRRILRRAVRHGYLLGFKEPFLYKLVDTLNSIMGDSYPYLLEKSNSIKEQIELEEQRFFSTIELGLDLFEKELRNTKDIFSGEVAFKLYDTFGFPLDLTEDMLKSKNIKVDKKAFDNLMQKQKQMAKAAWRGSGDEALSGDFKPLLEKFGVNEFVGYERDFQKAKVLALLDENFKEVDQLLKDQIGWVFLDKSPFYAQGGGQVGDVGELKNKAKVLDTKKLHELNLSKIKPIDTIKVDEEVVAIVDKIRDEIKRHHSATHLLHLALRKILGKSVNQAGSLVEGDRLRFDFSYPKALSYDEILKIENFVNNLISKGSKVETKIMKIDEAKRSGAIALFGEKYGDNVRVLSMGESVELCGGTHVEDISQIGLFLITKESGVSAGVRRIEAICSKSAYKYVKNLQEINNQIAKEVKNKDPLLGVKKLKQDIKELKKEIDILSSNSKKELQISTIKDTKVVVDTIDAGDIKAIIDEFKNSHKSAAIMLFQKKDNKVLIAAGVKNANIKAGEWIKNVAYIVGGGGGGRDDFAQAGGKDISKIDQAKSKALEFAQTKLDV